VFVANPVPPGTAVKMERDASGAIIGVKPGAADA
jgi:hypothetical protein